MKKVFVSLLTSDSYLPGLLTLLHSLRATSTLEVYCVTTTRNEKTNDLLERLFDKVIRVDGIVSRDLENLQLLQRPDLIETITKIHVFDIDAEMAIYLDADTLVLSNIEDLFDTLEDGAVFSAAPDQGWPDCFNSGVFCFRPSKSLFNSILEFSKNTASFDGGDQGLLNSFFSSWSKPGIHNPHTNRFSFLYNVTPSAFYSYSPAYKQFGNQVKVVHFIGLNKPWKWTRDSNGGLVSSSDSISKEFVAKWWSIFDKFNIAKLLQGYVLDRDWTKYVLDFASSSEKSLPSQSRKPAPLKKESLSRDLAGYTVGWKNSELGPYRTKSTKSPTKVKFDLDMYKINEFKSSSFVGDRGISPTSRSRSSKSSISSEPESPPKQIDLKTALYNTGSVLTRMQTDTMVENLDDYKVGWNKAELYTSSVSSPNPVSTSEKGPEMEIKKTKGYIRTDSFEISSSGEITYH